MVFLNVDRVLLQSGIIETAVDSCKTSVLIDLDGEVKGFWLLTE